MPMETQYAATEPTRAEIDTLPGPVLLEFGTSWCGYCQALQPHLAELLRQFPDVKHIKVEDGKGRPLGRSFRGKLGPTLVFRRDGRMVGHRARPTAAGVRGGLKAITGGYPVPFAGGDYYNGAPRPPDAPPCASPASPSSPCCSACP